MAESGAGEIKAFCGLLEMEVSVIRSFSFFVEPGELQLKK